METIAAGVMTEQRGNRAASLGRVRLRTLVRIRWVAIGGQAGALAIVHFGLDFTLPLIACLATIGISVALNVGLTAFAGPLTRNLSDRQAALYLAYDTVQIGALLFLTGGLYNPVALLILAPVTVSATVLSRGTTIGLGLLTAAAVSILVFWHEPFALHGPNYAPPDYLILGIWQALIIGLLFIAAYVGSVSEEARDMAAALGETQLALAREQRMAELGSLAAAAAHELGSPLATIAVVAREMQRDLPADSPLTADVQLLVEQAARCRDILAQLGASPHAKAAGGTPSMTLTGLLDDIAAPYRHAGKPIVVTCHARADAPAADEPKLKRLPEVVHAIGTLIQNAAQFASAVVIVDADWSAEALRIVIADDGPGFPPLLLDRLGEPYVSSRSGEGNHMGLGVFIAQTLLNRHGAQLSFANRPEGGAKVVIAWDRRDAEKMGR
jgi:two-component system sensor histidine kinase RegB